MSYLSEIFGQIGLSKYCKVNPDQTAKIMPYLSKIFGQIGLSKYCKTRSGQGFFFS